MKGVEDKQSCSRILCLIGHPEHPEVEDILQSAVANFNDWDLAEAPNLEGSMVNDSFCIS